MTKKNMYTFLACFLLAGYSWLGGNLADSGETTSGPTVCLFKAATHLPCPSCGTTRALVLLMKGDIRNAVLINPLGLLMALALVIVPLWMAADSFRKTDSLFRWYTKAERLLAENKWVSVPAVAVVLINWFWNIAKGL